MIGLLQDDVTFFASFLVLFIMGCTATALSIFFHLKFNTLMKAPKNLSVRVFDKTFNIFDIYPKRRKSIHVFISFFLIFAIVGPIIFTYIMAATIFKTGLFLAFIVLIICVNLMMLEEAFDVYTHANIFIKAIRNGELLGKGDLAAFNLVKELVPRLKVYYFFLAMIFFVSSIMFPYIVSALLSCLSLFLCLSLPPFQNPWVLFGPYFAVFLFAISITVVHLIAKKLKGKIFGLRTEKISPIDLDAIKDVLGLGHGILVAGMNEEIKEE